MQVKRTYRILKGSPASPSSIDRSPPPPTPPSLDELALELYKRPRRLLIAEAAYYRAARRGFADGDPLQDWLAAEREVDARLAEGQHSPAKSRSSERNHK